MTSVSAGVFEATLAPDGARTRVISSHHRAPLVLQRPRWPDGDDACELVLLHNGGGVVGGDRLHLDIHLQAGARAVVTTASAGKLYRSAGPEARQDVHLTVGPGAKLEWVTQEGIVYANACYRQVMRADLAADAALLLWEVTRFGRTARGERFTGGEWRSAIEVYREGRPVWIDRQYVPGSEALWASPHGLDGQPVVGTLAWLGRPVDAALVEAVREAARGIEGQVGTSQLPEGLVCRFRGAQTSAARDWFQAIRTLLRQHEGRPAPAWPRAWQPWPSATPGCPEEAPLV